MQSVELVPPLQRLTRVQQAVCGALRGGASQALVVVFANTIAGATEASSGSACTLSLGSCGWWRTTPG